MNNQHLLDVVTSRSKKQIGLSTIILSVILVVNIVVVLFFAHQGDLRRAEFEQNSNLHLIDISGRENGARASTLVSADLRTISEISQTVADASVSPLYSFGTGFELPQGESIAIYGIDPAIADTLGLDSMKDGVVYGQGVGSSLQGVLIPVLTELSESGAVSTDAVTKSLQFSEDVDPVRFDYLTAGAPGFEGFVTADTYWEIAQQMFGKPQQTIIQEYDAGKTEMIPVYSSVLVSVHDFNKVREVAAALEDNGYSTGFALRAFESIENGLNFQRNVSTAVIGLVALAAIVFFVVTWRSYLALSRRDIGILKHWKLSDSRIENQYSRVLLRTIAYPTLFSAVTATIVSLLLFPPAVAGQRIATTLVVLLLGGLVLYGIIRTWLIRSQTKLDVLTLLNHERQFQ